MVNKKSGYIKKNFKRFIRLYTYKEFPAVAAYLFAIFAGGALLVGLLSKIVINFLEHTTSTSILDIILWYALLILSSIIFLYSYRLVKFIPLNKINNKLFFTLFVVLSIILLLVGSKVIQEYYRPPNIEEDISAQYEYSVEDRGHSFIKCKPQMKEYGGFAVAPDAMICIIEADKHKIELKENLQVTIEDFFTKESETWYSFPVYTCGKYHCAQFRFKYTKYGINQYILKIYGNNMTDNALLSFESFSPEQYRKLRYEKTSLLLLLISLSLFSTAGFVKYLKDIIKDRKS